MVEVKTPKRNSKKQQAASAAEQTTPDSEKPRVQLELKTSTSPPNAGAAAASDSNQEATDAANLDLLKQTVAQLKSSAGVESTEAANDSSAAGLADSSR